MYIMYTYYYFTITFTIQWKFEFLLKPPPLVCRKGFLVRGKFVCYPRWFEAEDKFVREQVIRSQSSHFLLNYFMRYCCTTMIGQLQQLFPMLMTLHYIIYYILYYNIFISFIFISFHILYSSYPFSGFLTHFTNETSTIVHRYLLPKILKICNLFIAKLIFWGTTCGNRHLRIIVF